MCTRVFMSGLAGVLLLIPFSEGLARQDPVTLLQNPTILTVDPSSNTASGVLHLRNDRGSEVRVHVTSSDFISKTSNKGLNAKAAFFGLGDKPGAQILEVKLAAGEALPVRVEVANVWEAGESEAHILANGTTIGTVRALKYRLPFNVKLVSSNPDKPELAFVEGEPRQVALRNDDGMTYVVRPALSVKGHTLDAPSLLIPPNSSGAVTIDPPSAWFSRWTGALKEEQTDGLVILRFEPPGIGSDPAWPVKVIPFAARLSAVAPFWQGLLGLVYILILLLAGGVCSLLSRYWVPNSLRRATLGDGLNRVAERTRALSVRTGSEIRVGLRVERQKLIERLHSRWGFSPELPALLSEISRRIDELNTHLDLVIKLNELWETLDELYKKGEAPSKLSRIEEDVRLVSNSLKRIPSTTPELQAIQARINEAVSKMDQLSKPDPEWEKELQELSSTLIDERAQLEEAYPLCKGLFSVLSTTRIGTKEDSDRVDTAVSILRMIRSKLEELGRGPRSTMIADTEFDEAVRHRDYRAARKAMREIDQGVYREDVIEALKKPDPVPWVSAPTTVREYSPVHFTVRFPNPRMDNCEALESIRCEWDFGHDGLKEAGWQVAHFFPRPKKAKFWEPTTYTVTARFSDQGKAIKDAAEKRVEIRAPITVEALPTEKQSRTLTEVIQLAIALLIALLGLLAGAREQLQKLDFLAGMVALFLLGFGADSIRTVFAPTKGAQEPQVPGA